MIGRLEYPLTRTALAQSWCRTVSIVIGLLDLGTQEQSRLTTTSMSSKASWFRAQNPVDRSMAASLPSNSLLVARVGNVELDSYPQLIVVG